MRDADGLEPEVAAPFLDTRCDGLVVHVARY
jgi:hypothetical protein